MMEIFEKAYAKVNISLDVLGLLPNGYHEMRMVMQSVSLCDDVFISLNDSGFVNCESDAAYLPKDEGNIAVRAAKKFFEAAGMENTGANIRITKRTPTCAGMGGGSSDGAAVLRGLNRLCENPFSRAELDFFSVPGNAAPFVAVHCARVFIVRQVRQPVVRYAHRLPSHSLGVVLMHSAARLGDNMIIARGERFFNRKLPEVKFPFADKVYITVHSSHSSISLYTKSGEMRNAPNEAPWGCCPRIPIAFRLSV